MINFQLKKTLDASNGKMVLDVSGQISEGEFAIIYGPSGAGKTSILRMLAGLSKPDNGLIQFKDEIWFDSNQNKFTKPNKRNIGFVWQEYALFPNMTVRENLQFALDGDKNEAIINQLISIIELENLQHKKPKNLSGGQQQRVALARALVRQPSLLLLDEPLSALDESMRLKLQSYLLKVHNEFNLTTILVSHDLAEIFRMGDKIFLLQEGKISKRGLPEEVFSYQSISGKFRIIGTVVKIEESDVVFIVNVLIGNQIIKVVATDDEMSNLAPGDKVAVISKAFNPIILKLEH